MSADNRLSELGLELPDPPQALGLYRPLMVVGDLAYTSGHGPVQSDGSLICGTVGVVLTVEQGQAAARQVGLGMLATLRSELGSLDRVKRLVKTFGLVHASEQFTEHATVINGFSELMRDVFGDEAGIGARSAVGAVSLPAGMAVEIEAVFEISE